VLNLFYFLFQGRVECFSEAAHSMHYGKDKKAFWEDKISVFQKLLVLRSLILMKDIFEIQICIERGD
jgi:hypothetical protein